MATSIKIDEDLETCVQHLADVRRRSAHWIMREAIQQYVEREEKREAFKQDALRAWNECQATGPCHRGRSGRVAGEAGRRPGRGAS